MRYMNVEMQRTAEEFKKEKIVANRRRDRLRPRAVREADHATPYAELIAFDPGGTTGWCMMLVQPEALSPLHPGIGVLDNVVKWHRGQVDCGSVRGNLGTSSHPGISTSGEAAGLSELLGLCRAWPYAAVVVEDFILDPKRFNTGRDLLSPVRITNGISYDLWLQERTYFVQGASLAKTTATDEKLKAWGYYTSTGGLNHARDADRHALTFLKRAANPTKRGRDLREAAWPHLYGPKGEYYEAGRRKQP